MSNQESISEVVPKVPLPDELEPERPEAVTKKDPKRVQQGKRLAAISREAKERKMREKIESERGTDYSKYIFPAVSAISTFAFFYLWFSAKLMKSAKPMKSRSEISPPLVDSQAETFVSGQVDSQVDSQVGSQAETFVSGQVKPAKKGNTSKFESFGQSFYVCYLRVLKLL